MAEQVILVDKNDNQIGTEEKIQAHKDAKLHRCFSIQIINSKGEFMLQLRGRDKYHCGGLWTNTCCSHPRPGEDTTDAAHRRLQEEMGFDCELEGIDLFIYKKKFDNGLTEHEYDHLFVGQYDGEPRINPEEADDWKWISLDELREGVALNPDKYTYWSKIAFVKVAEYLANK